MGNSDDEDEEELPFPLPFPDDENDVDNNCVTASLLRKFQSADKTTTLIDRLPPDVFVVLCSYLTIRDIFSIAESSKSLYKKVKNPDLWLEKFQCRWNYQDETITDWYFAYQQAYCNPHNVWITHWNCVKPNDGLGPGRCCIEQQHQQIYDTGKKKRCRY